LELSESALGVDLAVSDRGDIDLVSGESNLAQAILHRLRTIKGELAEIGHGSYGSNIFNLVGEPNNEMTRARIKMAVREVLLQEPRVKEIRNIIVRTRKLEAISIASSTSTDNERGRSLEKVQLGRYVEGVEESHDNNDDVLLRRGGLPEPTNSQNTVEIDISIIPLDSQVPLNLVIPFYLEAS
jgi:phage baseplate assembly protein W